MLGPDWHLCHDSTCKPQPTKMACYGWMPATATVPHIAARAQGVPQRNQHAPGQPGMHKACCAARHLHVLGRDAKPSQASRGGSIQEDVWSGRILHLDRFIQTQHTLLPWQAASQPPDEDRLKTTSWKAKYSELLHKNRALSVSNPHKLSTAGRLILKYTRLQLRYGLPQSLCCCPHARPGLPR